MVHLRIAISRRELYVSCFACFNFRKQSGPAFQVIYQCTNKASRELWKQEDTGNRKEPAELKLVQCVRSKHFGRPQGGYIFANIIEVYAWSY